MSTIRPAVPAVALAVGLLLPACSSPDTSPARDAVAEYALQAWIHALNSNDTGALLRASGDGPCDGCVALRRELTRRERQGRYVALRDVRVRRTDVALTGRTARVRLTLDLPESQSLEEDGSYRSTNPAHPGSVFEPRMVHTRNRCRVTGIQPLRRSAGRPAIESVLVPTPTSPPPEGSLSRRAVLAGALVLAGGGLTACTTDRPSDDSARRGRPARPEVDPDVALATTALVDVRRTLELVEATAERHPRLRQVLASPRAVHEQHVELLAGAVPAAAPSPSPSRTASPARGPRGVPRNQGRALADVLRAEQQLATTLTTHALAARSGAFARALGSMGAAAAQQAAALPTGVRDGAGGPR